MNLIVYDKPASGSGVKKGLSGLFSNWRRTSRAIGGYWTGSFEIKRGSMLEWTDYYNNWLGNVIKETTYGITSWEGIIWQMDLVKNGINYRRTLDPSLWHNRIDLFYTDENGEQQYSGTNNTSSQEIYGISTYQYQLGTMSSNGAAAFLARALAAYAWPASRTAGGVTVGRGKNNTNSDGLYVTCTGLWSTLNWISSASTSTGTAASSAISTLVGLSEFVTAGRIETNSLAVSYDGSSIYFRVGDEIRRIIEQGDASGNVWKGGVYKDKEFIYEQAPTVVDYVYNNGILYTKAGGIVTPELLEPGFYVRDTNAPTGTQPPGTSNVWDDPQVSYCDEVEFHAPNVLRLSFTEHEERPEVLLEESAFESSEGKQAILPTKKIPIQK